MFGLFKKKGAGPSADEVVAHARAAVLAHRPGTGIEERGLALALTVGQRQLVWNLHDVARLAPEDPDWRAGLESMARKVVERLGSSDFGGGSAAAVGPSTIQVRLRPSARVAKLEDSAVEEIVPGLSALYVVPSGEGRASLAKWSEVDAGMKLAAVANTLGAFKLGDVMTPLQEGVPIFTNQKFHPNVAALLLLHQVWPQLAKAVGREASSIVVAAPAASRLMICFEDAPPFLSAMAQLAQSGTEVEEELLYSGLLRFTGSGWEPVAAGVS